MMLAVSWPATAAAQYTHASVGIGGAAPNGWNRGPALSGDGRYVTFVSDASNLVPGDTNGKPDVFVRDLQAGVTTRVNVTSTGAQAIGDHPIFAATSISDDGRFVVFNARANLVPQTPIICTNLDCETVYLHDRQTGQTSIVSLSNSGVPGNAQSNEAKISGDGRFVVFVSNASNLVPGDTNGKYDIFLRDLQAGTTTRISTTKTGGQLDGDSMLPVINTDASYIGYSTIHPSTSVQYGSCVDQTLAPSCSTVTLFQRLPGTYEVTQNRGSIGAISSTGRYLLRGNGAETNGVTWFEYSLEEVVAGSVIRRTDIGSTGGFAVLRADGRAAVLRDKAEYGGRLMLYDDLASRTVEIGFERGNAFSNLAISADGSRVAFTWSEDNRPTGVYVLTIDGDKDGLPDHWERTYGLDPLDPADAASDADTDGVSNLQEYRNSSHPTGTLTQYLAEGSSNPAFMTEVAILNPHPKPVSVTVRMLRGPGESALFFERRIPAHSRITLNPFADTHRFWYSDFSTVIESDAPVVADRTMWTINRYGHGGASESATQPSTTWYFAEGATGRPFSLFYLLQNPGEAMATVTVTYLRPSPLAPIVKKYDVAPRSRRTIAVDSEAAALANTNISAKLESDQPIVAERALYLASLGQPLGAMEGGAGARAPATKWFFAEGATGTFFDLYVLIANPGVTDANVSLTYLLPDGTNFSKSYLVPAASRQTIFVDAEDPRLENTPVSIIAESVSGGPIVAERAQWWPQGHWYEGHLSIGATVTATKWATAGGFEDQVTESRGQRTYLLIANTSATAGTATVTLMFEDGGAPLSRIIELPANSRTNVPIGDTFPEVRGRRFGAVVESTGVELVVERAMYRNVDGITWAVGTANLGTPLQ